MPSSPPSPPRSTRTVAAGSPASPPRAVTIRTRPGRSVTRARPSGRNAMSHGASRPRAIVVTRASPGARAVATGDGLRGPPARRPRWTTAQAQRRRTARIAVGTGFGAGWGLGSGQAAPAHGRRRPPPGRMRGFRDAPCPQRDSNPCRRLERAVSWAARRWGPARPGGAKRGPGVARAPRRAPVAAVVCRGRVSSPRAAAALRGHAPSYCHLHWCYAIGPPPFRGRATIAGRPAGGQPARRRRPYPPARRRSRARRRAMPAT